MGHGASGIGNREYFSGVAEFRYDSLAIAIPEI
jgi:hypothetical protein